jgi:hypothetical protein
MGAAEGHGQPFGRVIDVEIGQSLVGSSDYLTRIEIAGRADATIARPVGDNRGRRLRVMRQTPVNRALTLDVRFTEVLDF